MDFSLCTDQLEHAGANAASRAQFQNECTASLASRAFNFRHPEEWTKSKRRFDRYRVASGHKSQAEVNALIYCMGDESEDILGSFELSEWGAKQYETVRSMFDAHFIPRRNIMRHGCNNVLVSQMLTPGPAR